MVFSLSCESRGFFSTVFVILFLGSKILDGQSLSEPNEEWRYIGGNASDTRYSALNQINEENFDQLEVAWV